VHGKSEMLLVFVFWENKKLFLMCSPSQVFQNLSFVDMFANKGNIVLFENV
jgi:hypothetical protein